MRGVTEVKVEIVQYRGEAATFADVTGQMLDGSSGSPAATAPVIASGTLIFGRVTCEMMEAG